MDKVEVMCLAGLDEACVGYQVAPKGGVPVLVYDYAAAIDKLRMAGYTDEEIQEFLIGIAEIKDSQPPIFVKLDRELQKSISGGERYFFDGDHSEHTLH
jgi:hypothetical protein